MPTGSTQSLGTFVEPRGMVRSIIAGTAGRELLGPVAGMAAQHASESKHADSSPIHAGQIAYLALTDDELTLFRAKRGAFRPKVTDETIATALRTSVRGAAVDRGRLAGVLEVTFDDDSTWTFDVPKVHLSGADEIVAALG
jgi:hypothetical protein